MKKKLSLIMTLVFVLLTIISVNVFALSYPSIYPKVYKLCVPYGTVAKLQFTIFPEYKNEKYNINIYKGTKVANNKLVVSLSDTTYNTEYVRELTVPWNTAGMDCGTYTVEYYMSFYSVYEWHDAPTKSSFTIQIFKPGQVANSALNTDIKAFIDGYPIRSYNIDGYTCIVVEDLSQYGFDISYDNKDRTLKIDDFKRPVTSTYKHISNTKPVGSKAMNVYYTDIITYVKSKNTTGYLNAYGYNVGGQTLIRMDELDQFGSIVWNENARTISFKRI